MKKLIFLALLAVTLGGSCSRTFHSYVSDGKGGTYRIGGHYFYTWPISLNYVEYCKPEGTALVCREVKVTGPGL
jgi:hypothetical protein